MKISVFLRNEEQLQIIMKYPISVIYTDDLNLVLKYPFLYYQVPKSYEKDMLPSNLLIQDVGLLYELSNDKNKVIIDYGMNVSNDSSIQVYKNYGVEKICLSVELSFEEFESFPNLSKEPVEVLIYGRVVDMILKKHPLFKESGIYLQDVMHRLYPVVVLDNGNVFIYHHEPINKISLISSYLSRGISQFRLDFFDESKDEISFILNKICQDFTILR